MGTGITVTPALVPGQENPTSSLPQGSLETHADDDPILQTHLQIGWRRHPRERNNPPWASPEPAGVFASSPPAQLTAGHMCHQLLRGIQMDVGRRRDTPASYFSLPEFKDTFQLSTYCSSRVKAPGVWRGFLASLGIMAKISLRLL